jgi:hypothetical protein
MHACKDYRQLRYYWRERIKNKFNVEPSMDLNSEELKELLNELEEKHSRVINKPQKHNYEQLALTETNQSHTVDRSENSPSAVENFYEILKEKHNLSDRAMRDIDRGISPLLYGRSPTSHKPIDLEFNEGIEYLEKLEEDKKKKEKNQVWRFNF